MIRPPRRSPLFPSTTLSRPPPLHRKPPRPGRGARRARGRRALGADPAPRPRGAPLPLGGAAEARLYLPAVAGELPAREGPRRGGPQGQAPPRGPPRAGRRRRRLPRPPPDLGRPPRGEREAARDIVAGAAR